MPIYLDNAATSHPKPEAVYRAVSRALRTLGGNPGRGSHRSSLDADRMVLTVREQLARFFGIADASRLTFTANATHALNQALFGLLRPGDRVVTTCLEHNAVTRPLHALAQRGVTVVKVPVAPDGRLDPRRLLAACRPRPALVVMTHCSNVCGALLPVAEIGSWCRREEVPLLVDASQSAGHVPIDVEAMGIDLLAVPGHKGLLGPQGTGLLYVRSGLELTPLLYGGTGSRSSSAEPPPEMPERLEAGTLNLPGIAGLGAGVAWLQRQGLDRVQVRVMARVQQLVEGVDGLPGVRVVGLPSLAENGGVVSLAFDREDPATVGFRLDREYGIQVRTGLHCAPDAHRSLGTFPAGTLRVSPGPFTTEAEIDALLAALRGGRLGGDLP